MTAERRVALVTGARQGIGAAIAARLAADGATVVAADILPADEATPDVLSTVVDLTDRAARRALVPSVVAEHGRLDVLVNNAAYHGERVSVLDLTEDDWDRVIETNLSAAAFLCRAAAAEMIPRGGGSIVNIAAIQARLPLPSYAAYAASKGGVIALTRALAAELSASGVRVNAVEPGVIRTSAYAAGMAEPRPATLLGRMGGPEELAAVVAFLAGAEASFVTGAVLPVDGGRTLSRLPDELDTAYRGVGRAD